LVIQGFIKPGGERKLLLVNRRDREMEMALPEAAGARIETIDQTTGSSPPSSSRIEGGRFKLNGLGVAVVTLSK